MATIIVKELINILITVTRYKFYIKINKLSEHSNLIHSKLSKPKGFETKAKYKIEF